MTFFGLLDVFGDLFGICEHAHVFEESGAVFLNLLRGLGPDVAGNRLEIFTGEEVQRLAEFLEVAAIPLQESLLHENVLFDAVFFSVGDIFIATEVGAVLALDFFFDQFPKPIWPGEESVVLDYLQALADSFLRDADGLAREDLWAQVGLLETDDLVLDAATFAVGGLVRDHGQHVVLHLEGLSFASALRIILIFELIQINRVHFEVNHVELFSDLFLSNFLLLEGPAFTILDHLIDILVLKVAANRENGISSVVEHLLHFLLLEAGVFRRQASLLDNHGVELQLERLPLNHLLLHGVSGHQAEHLHNFRLADSVGPVHRLQVDLGVPVTVVQDDYVGGHEVETEATRSCRDQEDVYLTVGGGKLVDLLLSSVKVSPTI